VLVAEVRRGKALTAVVEAARITDASGRSVDVKALVEAEASRAATDQTSAAAGIDDDGDIAEEAIAEAAENPEGTAPDSEIAPAEETTGR
jgi:trigger factor